MHPFISRIYWQLFDLGTDTLGHPDFIILPFVCISLTLGGVLDVFLRTMKRRGVKIPALPPLPGGIWTVVLVYGLMLISTFFEGTSYFVHRWGGINIVEAIRNAVVHDWMWRRAEKQKRRVLRAFREGTERSRRDGQRRAMAERHFAAGLLRPAFEHWALRPGGVLFRQARDRFETETETGSESPPAC